MIRDGYTSALPYAEIARQLPHRTTASVAARARKLGLISYARRWSIHDDQRLIALTHRGRTLEDVAQRSAGPRRRSAGTHRGLGIDPPQPAPAPRHARRWTRRGGRAAAPASRAQSRPASPSCSDARTPPSADDCARSGCAPGPSAPPTIRQRKGRLRVRACGFAPPSCASARRSTRARTGHGRALHLGRRRVSDRTSPSAVTTHPPRAAATPAGTATTRSRVDGGPSRA